MNKTGRAALRAGALPLGKEDRLCAAYHFTSQKMRSDSDSFAVAAPPQFLEQAEELKTYLQTLDYDQCRALWRCNDAIAALNFERVRHMDLRRAQTPALFSYDGIQYRYMAPNVFSERELSYVQEHLRILSGFYGLLAPL